MSPTLRQSLIAFSQSLAEVWLPVWDRFLQVWWLLFGLRSSLGKGETVGCYWPIVTTHVGWDCHLYKESGQGIPPPSSLNSYIKFPPFWPGFSLILVFHNVWKNLHDEEERDRLQPLLPQLLSRFFLLLILATLHHLFRISLRNLDFHWETSTSAWLGGFTGLSGGLTQTFVRGQPLDTTPSSSWDYRTCLFTVRTRMRAARDDLEDHLSIKLFFLLPRM